MDFAFSLSITRKISSGIRRTLVVLLVFMVAVASMTPAQAAGESCNVVLISKEQDSKGLSLLGTPIEQDRLQISDFGSTREKTDLERGFTNTYSRAALRYGLSTREGAMGMLNHLIRLGFVEESAKDPIYAQFMMVADNRPISLVPGQSHDNPVVNKFIRNMKYAKLAKQQGGRLRLSPLPEHQRVQTLYYLFLSVFKTFKDQDIESRDAINASLSEIGRARDRGLSAADAIELGMGALKAYGTYIPSELNIWPIVDTIAGEIPFGTMGLETFKQVVYFAKGGSQREQKQEIHEIGKEPMQRTLVEESQYLVFKNRDPRQLQAKVKVFMDKYTKCTSEVLFSTQFAMEAIDAYPEIGLASRAQKKISRGVNAKKMITGVFGTHSYDTYVRLARMAITFQILQSDHVLPHLPRAETRRLQRELYKDIGLQGPNGVDAQALDRFFVLLNLDSISNAIDPFINAFDIEHNLSQRFGTLDKEKRTIEILRRYRLSSYSFARLPVDQQNRILEALELSRQYNVMQITKGELAADSLVNLSSVKLETLMMTYMNGLLTFAAEGQPSDLAQGRLVKLNRETYTLWESAAELMYKSTKAKSENVDLSGDTQVERLREQQRTYLTQRGLKGINSKQQEKVRLALLFDTKLNIQLKTLMESYDQLPQDKRNDVDMLLSNNSIRWFHLSKTLTQLTTEALRQVSGENPNLSAPEKLKIAYGITLTQLAKFSRILDDNEAINSGLEISKNNMVSISLAPYLGLLKSRGVRAMENSWPVLSDVEGGGLVITVP